MYGRSSCTHFTSSEYCCVYVSPFSMSIQLVFLWERLAILCDTQSSAVCPRTLFGAQLFLLCIYIYHKCTTDTERWRDVTRHTGQTVGVRVFVAFRVKSWQNNNWSNVISAIIYINVIDFYAMRKLKVSLEKYPQVIPQAIVAWYLLYFPMCCSSCA